VVDRGVCYIEPEVVRNEYVTNALRFEAITAVGAATGHSVIGELERVGNGYVTQNLRFDVTP